MRKICEKYVSTLEKENEANGDVEVKDYRCSSTLRALGRSAKKHGFGPKSFVFD